MPRPRYRVPEAMERLMSSLYDAIDAANDLARDRDAPGELREHARGWAFPLGQIAELMNGHSTTKAWARRYMPDLVPILEDNNRETAPRRAVAV